MPIYEYQCQECQNIFEFEPISSEARDKIICPNCKENNSNKFKKLISQTSFVLKGGCWAKDNYSSSK